MGSTTADNIINTIRDTIAKGGIIPPGDWLNMAFDLNALIGEENDRYAENYRLAHRFMIKEIEDGKSASEAEARMKAGLDYEEFLKQKGKVEQIAEFIKIAKVRGRMANEEYLAGNI